MLTENVGYLSEWIRVERRFMPASGTSETTSIFQPSDSLLEFIAAFRASKRNQHRIERLIYFAIKVITHLFSPLQILRASETESRPTPGLYDDHRIDKYERDVVARVRCTPSLDAA